MQHNATRIDMRIELEPQTPEISRAIEEHKEYIHALGVTVAPVKPNELFKDMLGAYLHDKRAIYLSPNLSARQARSTLMHELVHAELEHKSTDPNTEQTTRTLAAQRLIGTPQALAGNAAEANIAAFLAVACNVLSEDVIDFARTCPEELGTLLVNAVLECAPTRSEPFPELKAAIKPFLPVP